MQRSPFHLAARLALVVMAALAPSFAAAQTAEPRQTALDHWQPGLDPESKAGVNGAERPLLYSYELWLTTGYVHNLLEVADDDAGITGALLGHRLGLHLGGSMAVLPGLQLGLNLPVALLQARGAPVSPAFGALGELPLAGIGDLSLAVKYHLLSADRAWLNLALIGGLSAPSSFPRDAYMGESAIGLSARAAASREILDVGLAAEFGYYWRPSTRFLDATIGPEFRLGVGASYDLQPRFALPLEAAVASHIGLRHDAPLQGLHLNELPTEVLVEASYLGWLPLVVSGGVGVGVVAGIGTPDVRALVGLRWRHRPADRDDDRIPDHVDACPDAAADDHWLAGRDGCPDGDRDGDGITDRKDKCPDEPETDNDFEDADGCPDSRVDLKKDRLAIKGNVLFEVGKAVLLPESKKLLDEIADVLKANPQVEHVRIEGHTDSDGDAALNDVLSQNRADAVRRYLISRGVAGSRLSTRGYGERQPIATNETVAGKALNRRVDFLIEGVEAEGAGTVKQPQRSKPQPKATTPASQPSTQESQQSTPEPQQSTADPLQSTPEPQP